MLPKDVPPFLATGCFLLRQASKPDCSGAGCTGRCMHYVDFLLLSWQPLSSSRLYHLVTAGSNSAASCSNEMVGYFIPRASVDCQQDNIHSSSLQNKCNAISFNEKLPKCFSFCLSLCMNLTHKCLPYQATTRWFAASLRNHVPYLHSRSLLLFFLSTCLRRVHRSLFVDH